MLIIYGKYKNDKSFHPMDMRKGTYAFKIKYATKYDDKAETFLKNEMERLHNNNLDWEFKLIKKG